MRFAPQFFEGFYYTHLISQLWQYIFFHVFNLNFTGTPCHFFGKGAGPEKSPSKARADREHE